MRAGEGRSLFDRIRAACAEVARRAGAVRIDDRGLECLADILVRERESAPQIDPTHHRFAQPATTVAFVVTIIGALDDARGQGQCARSIHAVFKRTTCLYRCRVRDD